MLAHCNFLLAGILAGTLEPFLPVLFVSLTSTPFKTTILYHPLLTDVLQVFDCVDDVDGAASAA
eukprot:5834092-Pleurochrysis_carterae.AAC.1